MGVHRDEYYITFIEHIFSRKVCSAILNVDNVDGQISGQ